MKFEFKLKFLNGFLRKNKDIAWITQRAVDLRTFLFGVLSILCHAHVRHSWCTFWYRRCRYLVRPLEHWHMPGVRHSNMWDCLWSAGPKCSTESRTSFKWYTRTIPGQCLCGWLHLKNWLPLWVTWYDPFDTLKKELRILKWPNTPSQTFEHPYCAQGLQGDLTFLERNIRRPIQLLSSL